MLGSIVEPRAKFMYCSVQHRCRANFSIVAARSYMDFASFLAWETRCPSETHCSCSDKPEVVAVALDAVALNAENPSGPFVRSSSSTRRFIMSAFFRRGLWVPFFDRGATKPRSLSSAANLVVVHSRVEYFSMTREQVSVLIQVST